MPGLSSKEEHLIATLGERGRRIFAFDEATAILGLRKPHAYQIIHQLIKKHKIQRIEKGKYLLIPPVAWKTGKFTEERLVIASQLIQPYYVSYWTALNFYGWTEQPARTVFIATTKLKRTVDLEGTSFRFIKLKPLKFFGFKEQWFGDQKVAIAEKEKAIVDSLDQPRYAGEIVEVAKGLWNGRAELDFDRMFDYAVRMVNNAIVKRLGYLLDALGVLSDTLRTQVKEKLTYGYVDLDTNMRTKGQALNRDWRIRVNVNPRNLTEWIEH